MSNPYGWSPPTDGQPAVYFAPPGENVVVSASAANTAGDVPYNNGDGQYQSFMDQYQYVPQHDPFARSANTFNPFQSLSARGARAKVSIIDATILWLKNWNNFSGRASRSEYWWVTIVQLVVQVLWWVFFIGVLQMKALSPTDDVMNLLVTVVLPVTCVAMLVLSVPTLSLPVRRLHDTAHSRCYSLIHLLPYAISSLIGPSCWPDVSQTTRPPGRPSCWEAYACVMSKVALAFTRQWSSRSAMPISDKAPSCPLIAWLQTRTSRWPSRLVTSAINAAGASSWAKSALMSVTRAPSEAFADSSSTTPPMSSAPHGCSESCGDQCWMATEAPA